MVGEAAACGCPHFHSAYPILLSLSKVRAVGDRQIGCPIQLCSSMAMQAARLLVSVGTLVSWGPQHLRLQAAFLPQGVRLCSSSGVARVVPNCRCRAFPAEGFGMSFALLICVSANCAGSG